MAPLLRGTLPAPRWRRQPPTGRLRKLDIALRQSYLDTMRNRVREARAQRGMSQADVAAELGVSRQTVISIENGRYSPSLPLAFRIARLFESTVDKMFDPEDG